MVPLRGLLRAVGAMGLSSVLFAVVFFYAAPRLSGSSWQQAGFAGQTCITITMVVSERSACANPWCWAMRCQAISPPWVRA